MLAGVSTGLLVAIAIGYVVGSVPVALVVARRHGVPDLREVGDRNPGYWNTRRLLGWRAAVPVFVGDVAKGSFAAGLGVIVSDRWWAPFAVGGAAMVGHAFPILAGFRGGRSVLTFVGTMLVAAPLAAAIAVGVLLVVRLASGRFDRAARLAVVALPVVQLPLDGARATAATGVLMTFVGLRFATAAISERRAPGSTDPAS